MTTDNFDDAFEADARRIQGCIYAGLDAAYTYSASIHERVEGDDGHVFGNGVWRRSVFHLKKSFARNLPEATVTEPANSLRVEHRGYTMHFGKNPSKDVNDFRFNSGVREDLVARNAQMSLWEESHIPLMHLMVVHHGTPETGLEWIAIGLPMSLGGVERPWRWCEFLYDGNTSAASSTGSSFKPFTHVETPAAEIKMRLTAAKEDDDDEV